MASPLRALATLGASAALVASCSSGAGKFGSTTNPPHEKSDEAADAPGRDQTDDAPGAREGAACLPCTGSYRCSGTLDDLAQTSAIFSFKRDDCATSQGKNQGKDEGVLTFACGGTVTITGRNVVGNWKDVGAGVLEICFGVLGRDQCLTCTPSVAPDVAEPGNGGTRDAGRRD
jgi:hypothetical protein